MTTMALGSDSLIFLSASTPSMPAILTSRNTRSGRWRLYSVMPSTALATARTSYPSNSSNCPSAARIPCSSSMIRMRRAMLFDVLVQGDLSVRDPNVTHVVRYWQRERVVGQSLRPRLIVDLANEPRDHSTRKNHLAEHRSLHRELPHAGSQHVKGTGELDPLPIAQHAGDRSELAPDGRGRSERSHRHAVAVDPPRHAVDGTADLPLRLVEREGRDVAGR